MKNCEINNFTLMNSPPVCEVNLFCHFSEFNLLEFVLAELLLRIMSLRSRFGLKRGSVILCTGCITCLWSFDFSLRILNPHFQSPKKDDGMEACFVTSVHGAAAPVPPEMDGTVMVGQDFRGEWQIESEFERNDVESYTHIQAHTHNTCRPLCHCCRRSLV